MALLHPFGPNDTDAKQPITVDLMKLKYQENLQDLAVQIENIGGGGSGGSVDTGAIGEVLLGGKTNEAIYWKRRFSPFQHMLNSDSSNPSGFDPEGTDKENELLTFIQSNDSGFTYIADGTEHLGGYLRIAKDSKLSFKIKKGVNFFSLGGTIHNGGSDTVEVKIDGASVSSLGLTDENGNLRNDTYSMVSATAFYQVPEFFYGLDGEEHIITIENNDTASKYIFLGYVEVGYRSNDYAIDETVRISAGKANVRGSVVDFDETEVTFSKLDKNGHTGALVVNTAGSIVGMDGESPAMTQCKPEEEVDFTDVVTDLNVKNNLYFPDNGICLLSTPYGNHHLFSYSSKTDALIQAHAFNNLIWQSQPTEAFTPCNNFNGPTGQATGDLNINYWGTAPILVDALNDKLDFQITINGITTSHVATIAPGRYSADLVPIETAIRKAMQTAKPLVGEYHVTYNSDSHLWTIYVEDAEVEEFNLLFGSGANVGTSIASTLGFADTDRNGSFSYVGTLEREHLSCRVLEKDPVYMHVADPRFSYDIVEYNNGATGYADVRDLKERLNLGTIKYLTTTSPMIQVFVDEDACGLSFDFVKFQQGNMISVQIDDGPIVYPVYSGNSVDSASKARGELVTGFISFARGSRKITIRGESSAFFNFSGGASYPCFAGARQYFTKPCYEKLTKSQAIIKTFDVAPISLYATTYGHNGGTLYSPGATDDNINTITEVGSWTANPLSYVFNSGARQTSTVGDYVDVNFTLQGDGGGISMKSLMFTNTAHKVELYLSTGIINESTDRVHNVYSIWSSNYHDQDYIGLFGLPAGTYNARFKVASATANGIWNLGFNVIDTVAPQENANTVTDLTNPGQSICYPVNVIRKAIQQDANDRVPSYLQRSGYKEGITANINYALNSPSWVDFTDSGNLVIYADNYNRSYLQDAVAGNEVVFSGFCKSVTQWERAYTSHTTSLQNFVDGVQFLNTHSQQEQIKNGSCPTTTRSSGSRLVQKNFKLSCTFASGDTFNVNDTRGFKVGATVILSDGVTTEKAIIDSIIAGTSFTVKKARTLVVDINVNKVVFSGFHTFSILQNNSVDFVISAFEYEPLTVSPSKAILRRSAEMKYEKVGVTFRGVANGQDLYYPVHSDGIPGNWTTSTIEVIGKSTSNAYNFDQDLKNVYVSSGDIDVKITSERLVPVNKETK